MRKFTSDNKNIHKITFKGVAYFFIIDKSGIGVRRKDNKVPKQEDVDALTEYIFEEGWAERGDFEPYESWKHDE